MEPVIKAPCELQAGDVVVGTVNTRYDAPSVVYLVADGARSVTFNDWQYRAHDNAAAWTEPLFMVGQVYDELNWIEMFIKQFETELAGINRNDPAAEDLIGTLLHYRAARNAMQEIAYP